MKRLKIVYGWGSARSRRRSLRRSPDPLVGWGGMSPSPYSSPIDAFDCSSWTFVGTTRKDGQPQFLKRGCALGFMFAVRNKFAGVIYVLATVFNRA